MKGIVFTEFIDFVDQTAGYEVVDRMIEVANPATGGSYTSVGKYDYSELADLIGALSGILDIPAPVLIRMFGRHLFSRFAVLYPRFFVGSHTAIDFLEGVEDRIHVEVRKLYPDAELPSLKPERIGPDTLRIHYSSCRPLAQLCMGLVEGCGDYFGVKLEVEEEKLNGGTQLTIRKAVRVAA